MWIVGLSRFVIVVVLRPLLQDEPELQPDEEGSWTACSMCRGSACSIASWSRSWMCQCCGSWKKSWSLLLVRSSATLVQASGDSTGGRAHVEQIVDVPVPRILEQNVEVIKVIPEEQCQRMRFFSFDSVWGGGCGRHVPHVLPHSPLPHARVDSECKRWNLEHVVLDLFSHFTLGKVQVRWLFVSCRGSCPSNSPFALSRLANLTHAVAARFVSASPLGSTTTAVCCTSLRSNSSPPEIGRAVSSQLAAVMEARGDLQPPHIARERQRLQLRVIHLCARFGISQDRMWNPQIVYEKKTDRVRPHGPIFPRQLVSHTPTRWIAQDALLDMIDAIDADMNARPGDAEQRNCTAYTQPLDRAYMRAFKNSIRSEVAKHFAEFFLEAESIFERVNLDSTNSLLRECRQPATSNRWLALHRLEGGGAAA